MNSQYAIKALEEYIKSLSGKSKIYSKMNKEMNTWQDERIQSALEQIEMYKVGKWRLQSNF
jgi:hypothetical protein